MNWIRGLAGLVAFTAVVLFTGNAQSQPPPVPGVTFDIEHKKEKLGSGQWGYYIRTKGKWSNLPAGATPEADITEKSLTAFIPPVNPIERNTILYTVDFETDWLAVYTPPAAPNFHKYESTIVPAYIDMNGKKHTLPVPPSKTINISQ